MEYITIASVGNALDFGDVTNNNVDAGGTSNCHGGVQ